MQAWPSLLPGARPESSQEVSPPSAGFDRFRAGVVTPFGLLGSGRRILPMGKRLCLVASLLATLGVVVPAPGSSAAPKDRYTYATMSDGVKIALAVSYPKGFTPAVRWPALFMMDGYEGAAGFLDPGDYGNRYVMVHASLRGTGCSGRRFDLFDHRSVMDGYEII